MRRYRAFPASRKRGLLTHIEALDLDYAPARLIVLGGGYVGLELAQAYRRFGSRVTVIDTGPQIPIRPGGPGHRPGAAPHIESRKISGSVLSAEPVAAQGRSGESVSLTARDTRRHADEIEASDIHGR